MRVHFTSGASYLILFSKWKTFCGVELTKNSRGKCSGESNKGWVHLGKGTPMLWSWACRWPAQGQAAPILASYFTSYFTSATSELQILKQTATQGSSESCAHLLGSLGDLQMQGAAESQNKLGTGTNQNLLHNHPDLYVGRGGGLETAFVLHR